MSLNPPPSIPVATLLATHPEHPGETAQDLWRLYAGGKQFEPRRFIRPRRHEPADLYEERLSRAFFCGYIGEIIDSFIANLFLAEPSFRIEGKETLPDFYDGFAGNCNRARTDLNAFHRDRWTRALVQGRSYTWVELPEMAEPVADVLGEQTSKAKLDGFGARAAYLIPVNVLELVDYDRDGNGNFRWALIHQQFLSRGQFSVAERELRHRWTVLGTDEFAVYEATEEYRYQGGTWKTTDGENFRQQNAARVITRAHAFGQVPIVELCLPQALCIGEKLFDLQRAITELDNAITWQQLMSLFAMPVVKTDRDFQQTMGEAYYIKLESTGEFGWSEPAGTAIKTSMERRAELKEELFRIAHQMAQAIRSEAQTAGRSGESKRRDSNPTQIVLEYLGQLARDHELEILRMVARGRQEDPTKLPFMIDGFDEFDVEDLDKFLANQVQANLITIHSETYVRENEKRIVRKMHPDLSAETLKKIDGQIDSAQILMPGDELNDMGTGLPLPG